MTTTNPNPAAITLGSWLSFEDVANPYREGLIVGLDPLTVVWEDYSMGRVHHIDNRRIKLLDRPPADPPMCRQWSERASLRLTDRAVQAETDKRQREDREREWKKWLADHRPEGARAIIVAQYLEDQSDLNTDYHGSATRMRVFLGWSTSSRFSFAECRRAAKKFAPTAHLAVPNKDFEHRERYSMGGGLYLKDGWRHDTGWKVTTEWVSESCIPRACMKPEERDVVSWMDSSAPQEVINTESLADNRPLAKVIPFPGRGE